MVWEVTVQGLGAVAWLKCKEERLNNEYLKSWLICSYQFAITWSHMLSLIKSLLSLYLSWGTHMAGGYCGFQSMKWLGVLLLLPGWDASPLQDYPPQAFHQASLKICWYHLYSWVERCTVKVAELFHIFSPYLDQTRKTLNVFLVWSR